MDVASAFKSLSKGKEKKEKKEKKEGDFEKKKKTNTNTYGSDSSSDGTSGTDEGLKEMAIWQYSGRSGGFWAFQPEHNKIIERNWQEWVGSGTTGFTDGEKPNLTGDQCVIEIGYREYLVDFKSMRQWSAEDTGKKRTIRRQSMAMTLDRMPSDLKGVAGVFVDQKSKSKSK